jgi:quercetin dioxygenase-like cupin family protein
MPFIDFESLPQKEIVPGFLARFVHTEHVSIAFWLIDAGALMPEHSHPHEQVFVLIEGTLELTVAGDTRVLDAGAVTTIPPNASHSGRAITNCHAMDVFYPRRDDYA